MIGILADTPRDAELMRRAVAGGVRVIHAATDLTVADLGIECLVFGSRSGLLAERIAVPARGRAEAPVGSGDPRDGPEDRHRAPPEQGTGGGSRLV